MAESTASITYSDLREEVGFFLGYGRSSSNWTTDQIYAIESVVKSGLRQFYHPPRVPGDSIAWEWTFLKPVTSITLGPTTGTANGAPTYNASTSTSTLTATSAIFESRMADFSTSVTFGTSGTSYTISSYTSSTEVELSGDASGEASGDSLTISAQRDYDLPDNFGAIQGPLTFTTNTYYDEVPIVGEGQIRALRQGSNITGFPKYAAIRPIVGDGTTGQRFEILFHPAPDGTYTLKYAYTPLLDVLSSDYPYPMGGETHGETILESCLAVAERRLDDEMELHYQQFMERLRASVDLDRKANTPEWLGYNGDSSSDYTSMRVSSLNNYVTVDGVVP